MKTYPNIYYEIYSSDGEKCSVMAFDTLDEAIAHAEESGAKTIQRIGGDFAEFEKCEFCGEWYDVSELNIENYCERCREAIRAHGFEVDARKHNGDFYSF